MLSAQEANESSAVETETYKKLSLKELMDLEVTSVTRRPKKFSESVASIQVITQEDIRRSGASRIPEALRLASNLEVYQIDSNDWAISARGSNNGISNKLLVLLDGRTIYSPLFAGVFWDVQDTMIEDIERIEVISGPGSIAWGANAVNGVINITTKSSKETKGLMLPVGGGTELRDFIGVRYGDTFAQNANYRFYGKYFDRDGTINSEGIDTPNEWRMAQGGFRVDWEESEPDLFTFQGDLYDNLNDEDELTTTGANLIGRWTRTYSENSSQTLQLYFDRAHRRVPGSYDDVAHTYDADFQHRFPFGKNHDVVWGLGYRLIDDNIENGTNFSFLPADFSFHLFSAFIQDEIVFLENRLSFTPGIRIEHNDYTGFEVQPVGRLGWKINETQMLWGAISRALRSPARLDRDFFAPSTPPFTIAGGPNFVSEELIAYQIGYRIQPHEDLSLSIATFYHDYDKIRSLEQVNPPFPIPVEIANLQEGESYGAELTADYRFSDQVRVWAGYTELRIHFNPKPGSTDRTFGRTESRDPERQLFLRSSIDFGKLEVDPMFRYISEIEETPVPGYGQFDLRIGWNLSENLQLSVVAQNLLHDRRIEFGPPATGQAIERSIYGKIIWRY